MIEPYVSLLIDKLRERFDEEQRIRCVRDGFYDGDGDFNEFYSVNCLLDYRTISHLFDVCDTCEISIPDALEIAISVLADFFLYNSHVYAEEVVIDIQHYWDDIFGNRGLVAPSLSKLGELHLSEWLKDDGGDD